MYLPGVCALQADALFASALRGDELNARRIHQAITVSLNAYGAEGCAGRVAREFGDHPETAAARMRWARAAVAFLGSQAAPEIRRTAAA